MLETVVVDDLMCWKECRDCGLFQKLPDLPDGEAAVCARCDALLRRVSAHSLLFARVTAVLAAILFALALTLPLVELRVLGRSADSTVFSGPHVLRDQGLWMLAMVVIITVVFMPGAKLFIELLALFGVHAAVPQRWVAWLFGWLEHISPWAMIEVFLLGSVVAYSRLKALAHVDVGLAALALGGTMLAIVAIDATLDREALWQMLEARTPHPRQVGSPKRSESPGIGLIGCSECRRVVHAQEGERCVRCAHRLKIRKGSLGRVWAMVIASALLYIPANVLPVMTIRRMGRGAPTTILNGVVDLAQAHLWPLAALVLLASIIIPIVKLVSLLVLLITTHRHSAWRLKGRTRIFRFVKFVGRWSMIDIFMLSVLVGVVRFGAIASVLPGLGAAAFCGVVLLTMTATEMFDPRLMWDFAGRQEGAVERTGGIERQGELVHAKA